MVQGRPKRILWVEILNIATNVFIGCKKKQNLYWTGRLLKIFYPCARDLVTIDTNTFVQIKPNDCLLYCHIAYAHWSWSSKPNVVARFYSRHARQSAGRQGRHEGAQQHQRQSQACDLIVVSPLLPLHPHLQHDTE